MFYTGKICAVVGATQDRPGILFLDNSFSHSFTQLTDI